MAARRGSPSPSRYLSAPYIERAAVGLLRGYAQQFGVRIVAPIPVEEIVESHLGLALLLDDLSSCDGGPRRLGAISIRAREIVVDESLDPTRYPAREGRYRFTVGHEAGHWELHRELQMSSALLSCIAAQCRASREWQANQFAAALLMPRALLQGAWRRRHGDLSPYFAAEELAALREREGRPEGELPTAAVARELAHTFRVSGQAMQIRLIGLRLIRTAPPPPSLF